MSGVYQKYGVAYQGKHENKNRSRRWPQKDYIIKEEKDVEYYDLKMTCRLKIFPELQYEWPHKNPRGGHGLGRNYYFRTDSMIGTGKCVISNITR